MRLPKYLSSTELTALGRKTLLDRYARKAPKTKPLELNDLVIICTDKSSGQREIGNIIGLNTDGRTVHVRAEDGEEHTVAMEEVDKPVETDPKVVVQRVARALSKVEAKPKKWENAFKKIMGTWQFVPAGRILTGAGIQKETPLTFFNCNVIPAPKDSREGIIDTAKTLAELFSRGAGVGTHLSSLRPRYAYVKGVNGRSSGAVSWGSLYSHLTGLIEQGGCVVGETIVATTDGDFPIKDLVGETPEIYAYDLDTDEFSVKSVKWVAKTGDNKPIMKLTTDRGFILEATPDHKVLCADQTYREMRFLKKGMNLDLSLGEHIVESVEDAGTADVYDLEVPDLHNFYIFSKEKGCESGITIHNSRRGAAMLVLHVWHPDIYEFIECKREPKAKQLALLADKLEYGFGLDEFAKEARDLAAKWPANIQHANLSVGITDDFMEAVIHDRDWSLVFPDTNFPEYTEKWDGDLQKWQEAGFPVKVHKVVKARDLWNKLMYSAWDSGEPGVIYIDTVNSESTSWWYCNMLATNPCVTGDTRIAVADGRQSVPIKQLAEEGKDVPVFCTTKEGGWRVRWGRKPRLTKQNAEVWKVTLDDGSVVRATPNHKFMLRDGTSRELQELVPGDSLMPFVKGRYHYFNRDEWWITSSDGRQGLDREARIVAEFAEGRWPEKFPAEVVHHKDEDHWNNSYLNIEIKDNIQHSKDHSSGENNPMYGRTQSEETKAKIGAKTVERFKNEEFRRKHSEAVSKSMQGNPNVGQYERTPEVRQKLSKSLKKTYSENVDILSKAQQSLEKARSTKEKRIIKEDFTKYRTKALLQGKWLLDTVGEIKESDWDYYQEVYKKGRTGGIVAVLIPKIFGNWETFREQASSYNHKVVSVEFDGYEDVYNITVDEHHNYAVVTNTKFRNINRDKGLGGIAVLNCGEQPLSSNWGTCNLGALNLPRFLIEDPEDPNNVILDKESYKNAIYLSIRFLDNVIDTTPYFLEPQEINAKRERRVGLSPFMGLAEALVILGLKYGSEEAVDFVEEVGFLAASEALLASASLAEEKGCCEVLATPEDREQFLKSRYVQRVLRFMEPTEREALEKLIREVGTRNISFTTAAPTGTIGNMVATSTGIEPFFRYEYKQNTNLGVHIKRERVLDEWFHQHGENAAVPDYFVSAGDLTPQEHLKMVAALQRWIDSGISKTYNLPQEYTQEEVGKIYMEIWKRRCKGGTVFREGSRTVQVLESLDPKEKKNFEMSFPEKISGPPKGDKKDGSTWSIESPSGTLHATYNQYPTKDTPFETFLRIGKAGSDVGAMTEAFGRVISLFLQMRGPIKPTRRCELLVEQLEGIGGRDQVGFGPNKVRSIPDAIAKSISKHLQSMNEDEDESNSCFEEAEQEPSTHGLDMCPDCGNLGLRAEEGCTSCAFCGFSKC